MKTSNRNLIILDCHKYVQGKKQSILPDFVRVIDDENISTRVLEKLEFQFDMLYELQKDFWIEDDDRVIMKTSIVARQVIDILENNKN